MPVASLPLLAALTPAEHRVTSARRERRADRLRRIARADIVGLTGMSVQRARMREILAELKRRGAFTAVGGPWVTRAGGLLRTAWPTSIFVGEAEETWPQFLERLEAGHGTRPRYEQAEKTDMTQVPVPRYDLLEMQHYLFGSIQFSRGCPFQCEFCDIIVTFGRRPRLKTARRSIAELEALRARRMEIVFIVDDNLIGNKKAIKRRCSTRWSPGRRPTAFRSSSSPRRRSTWPRTTELMRLMVDGEHPERLHRHREPQRGVAASRRRSTRTSRRGGTIVERVRAVQDAGLEVWCGMILGFDHDDEAIFDAQREFLREARIAQAMIGMLYADPEDAAARPARRRGPARSRRRLPGSAPTSSPQRMSRDALRDGYVPADGRDLYEPDAYFERLDGAVGNGATPFAPARARYWRRHPVARLKGQAVNLARAVACTRG